MEANAVHFALSHTIGQVTILQKLGQFCVDSKYQLGSSLVMTNPGAGFVFMPGYAADLLSVSWGG